MGSDLPRGVVTLVRVAIESTRPLAEGDLLADRHGFVAPVTRIAAGWEMPRLPDGRVLDAVLPAAAGGPSAGTMTELRLGLAAQALDEWLVVPRGAVVEETTIRSYCERAGVSPAGQARLEAVWGVPATEVPVGRLYLVRMAPHAGAPSTR
jgi:DNA-directed RNA polymerase beta subunit